MSLSNPTKPVTEERLQEFYHKIVPYMGGGGDGQTIQVETLPTASEDELGNVYQYIGTTGTYTHGFFYECVSDGESTPTYSWEQTSVQPSTSGGHTIEDSEGTELEQRDTLQFGEGFIAEDDDTNEKTVISPDIMQSGDMSDVITPLPSVQPRYQKYSTTEQVIGEWINGKPLYQLTVPISWTGVAARTYTNILNMSSYNVAEYLGCKGFFINNASGDVKTRAIPFSDRDNKLNVVYDRSTKYLQLLTYEVNGWEIEGYVTIQYTKTTDTPNT